MQFQIWCHGQHCSVGLAPCLRCFSLLKFLFPGKQTKHLGHGTRATLQGDVRDLVIQFNEVWIKKQGPRQRRLGSALFGSVRLRSDWTRLGSSPFGSTRLGSGPARSRSARLGGAVLAPDWLAHRALPSLIGGKPWQRELALWGCHGSAGRCLAGRGGIRPCLRPVCLRGQIRIAVTLSPRVSVSLSARVAKSLSPRAVYLHPEMLRVMGEGLFFFWRKVTRGGATAVRHRQGTLRRHLPSAGRGRAGALWLLLQPRPAAPGAVLTVPSEGLWRGGGGCGSLLLTSSSLRPVGPASECGANRDQRELGLCLTAAAEVQGQARTLRAHTRYLLAQHSQCKRFCSQSCPARTRGWFFYPSLSLHLGQ